jgi:hypothetical protein
MRALDRYDELGDPGQAIDTRRGKMEHSERILSMDMRIVADRMRKRNIGGSFIADPSRATGAVLMAVSAQIDPLGNAARHEQPNRLWRRLSLHPSDRSDGRMYTVVAAVAVIRDQLAQVSIGPIWTSRDSLVPSIIGVCGKAKGGI